MQAIVVKYVGPTNTRGSKMRASAARGIKPINQPYDSALSVEQNAMRAAADLIKQQGWAMGMLPNGDYVFVMHSEKPYHDHGSIDTRSWIA